MSSPPPSDHQPFTLPLDSPESNINTTGGKGHNLAILSRDGKFPVPPGFVVTVAAARHFVSSSPGLLSDIRAALSDLHKDEASSTGMIRLEKISDAIRDSFRKREVPKELREEIASCLSSSSIFVDINNTYLAVRSSATCEDMPDASFAGQHDTELNVKPTVDNVCRHVVDCFSSLFTPRAISYRENNGIDHIQAGMAVVVQAMVQSESSGVLFTANPLTGRRNESVLEAIPGLGEALVSGLVEPDRYIVSRSSDTAIVIKDKRIGAKAKAIRSVEGGGVREEVISETTPLLSENGKGNGSNGAPSAPQKSATVLTDDDVEQLILLGQEVQALFEGKPQDIEWARSADGKMYVVQSRPITTLFPLPNVPAKPLQVFFSFSAVQGISGAMFPAGQDAIRSILGGLVRYMSWGKHGTKGTFLQSVAERLYGNVTNVLGNSIGRKVILGALSHIEPGIRAGIQEVLPDVEITSRLNPFLLIRIVSIYSVVIPRIIYCCLFPDHARERLVQRTDRIVQRVEEQSRDIHGLVDLVNFKQKTLGSFFPSVILHFIPRMAVAMGPLALLTKMASKIDGGKDVVLTMTRGLKHNCTSEMDLELWEIAKIIQNDDACLARFHSNDADTLADDFHRGNLPEASQNAIRRFMNAYGMRGLCEIDFGRPRWREEPAPLMSTLKSYVDIDDKYAPDRVFAAGKVAAEAAIKRLGEDIGKPALVSYLARRMRSIAGVRELPKFTIIRIMGIIREKMILEGKNLVLSGVLHDPKDVFLLHDDELLAIATTSMDNATKWKGLVDERKAVMASEAGRMRVPRVITSDGFGFYGGAASNTNVAEGSNILCGEPVSPGTYEGRVCVIHNPTEHLPPGAILVCHGTDPSWTPLFLSAGALIMEVGGLMTHGSVVAREYGLPAIVGLEKVTERLKTGQLVRVDGSSGVVEILEDASSEDKK